MNKKFLIALVLVVSIVVSLWIWTLAVPKNMISIGGSASVDPLMQQLTNEYRNHYPKKFIYSSTGSNSGISNLKKSVYDIAFISKDVPEIEFPGIKTTGEITKEDFVDVSSKEEFKEKIQKKIAANDYLYLNFTNEPIIFIYNIEGTGLDNSNPQTKALLEKFAFKVDNNIKVENQVILQKIYEHDNQNDLLTWRDLVNEIDLNFDSSQIEKKVVRPFSPSPGSGTWSSFKKITGVTPGEAVNKYGNNGSIFYQVVNSPGAFGFVSLSYAQTIWNNRDKKLRDNVKTVIIQNGDKSWNIAQDDPADVTNPPKNEYPLTRPFNAIFTTRSKNLDAVLEFVFWFSTSASAKKIYEKEGLNQILISKNNASFLDIQTFLIFPRMYVFEVINDKNKNFW